MRFFGKFSLSYTLKKRQITICQITICRNVVLTTFPEMTTVLKRRMSKGLHAEQATSDPRPRGRRRQFVVFLCNLPNCQIKLVNCDLANCPSANCVHNMRSFLLCNFNSIWFLHNESFDLMYLQAPLDVFFRCIGLF